MKKTKRNGCFRLHLSRAGQSGGRGGGGARERRGDRKERERKNDATRRCVCQRREKGPIGEAGAATRENQNRHPPARKGVSISGDYWSSSSRDEPAGPPGRQFLTVGAARSPEFLKFILTFLPSWSRRCRVFVDASSSLPPHV
jgi:hypothetical protein